MLLVYTWLLMENRAVADKIIKTIPRSFTAFVIYHLMPYRMSVVAFIAFATLSALTALINPNLSKLIIDRLIEVHNVNETLTVIFWPALLFVVNMELQHLSWRGMGYINIKIQPIIKNNVIMSTYEYVTQHSSRFFQDNLAGEIFNNINVLANNIERILHDMSQYIVRGLIFLIAAFFNMYFIHPQFFYGLLAWAIAFLCLSFYVSRRVATMANSYAESESQAAGQLVDRINNVATIRMFARSKLEAKTLLGYLFQMTRLFRNKERFLLIAHLLQGFSLTAMFAFMIYTLIYLRVQELVTIGDYALILGLSMEVGYILWELTVQLDTLSDALGKCNQSLSALFDPIEIQDQPNAIKLKVTAGKICCNNIMFQYNGTNPFFQSKFLTITSGQKVGLVGYSGSGKSTFVNLILRFYEVSEGCIRIDGQDIRNVTQDSLRENIAIIPQDTSLFHRTLMENIRYGRIDATDDEVVAAAKCAYAHEFISALPEGYQSIVGERGIKLSGGQRQRIAIARVILKNAPILILDEATSQLDSVTENCIQESLWRLMQGKTTVLIAHRLSTLLHMDRILVFDRGIIVEDGTHQELLAKGGLYKSLWDTQVGGFLPEKRN